MRWVGGIVGLAAGIALGLLAGWVIWPVEYSHVTPEYMRADLQIDYAIMVATAYGEDEDIQLARARLNRLGDESDIALLNAFISAQDEPETLLALQKLAAELGLHASYPEPVE